MEDEKQGRALAWLDTPRLAIGALVIYTLAISLFTLYLWDSQRKQVDQVNTIITERLKEAQAADEEQVTRCFSAATQGPVLRRVLKALADEAEKTKNRETLMEFRALSELNSPTLTECRRLADTLGVKTTRGVR